MARQYLAPSLDRLFNEINARWPNRDKRTDGWYTNSRESYGHNRNERGLVHAIDVDDDGIDENWIINNMYKSKSVLWYVIWDRRIWSNTYDFRPQKYTGDNPHTDHMHIEIYHTTTAEQYKGHWGIAPGASGFGAAPSESGQGIVGQAIDAIYSSAMNEGGRDYRGHIIDSANWFKYVGEKVKGAGPAMKGLRRL